jgi:peptidoglycan-associated lipoprotein
MKRAGLIVAALAVLVVLVVAGHAKEQPVQPPIPPPPRPEMISPVPETPFPGAPSYEPSGPGNPPYALNPIHFGFDQFDIRPSDARAMDDAAGYLRDNPTAALTLEGYCDPVGTDEYNRGLGLRRATAARAYLVRNGIDAARLAVTSYGRERLVTTDKAQFELNRRVEFVAK